jgi:hypothetical protein
MLKCIITFYDNCQRAIAESPAEKKVTWAYIKTTMGGVMQKVMDAKFLVRECPNVNVLSAVLIFVFQNPKTPTGEMKAHYDNLCKEIEEGFQAIGDV